MLEKGMLVKVIEKGLLGYGKIGIIIRVYGINNIRYQLIFPNGTDYHDYYYEDELLVLDKELKTFPVDNSSSSICNWCFGKCKSMSIKDCMIFYCPKCLR